MTDDEWGRIVADLGAPTPRISDDSPSPQLLPDSITPGGAGTRSHAEYVAAVTADMAQLMAPFTMYKKPPAY